VVPSHCAVSTASPAQLECSYFSLHGGIVAGYYQITNSYDRLVIIPDYSIPIISEFPTITPLFGNEEERPRFMKVWDDPEIALAPK
jgi:hypothetical protein